MIERRRRQRVLPPSPLPSRVGPAEPARVLDLSASGAQVEMLVPLRPSSECSMSMSTNEGPLRVRARVRRCRVVVPAEQGKVAYRAGLEFVALQPDQLAALEDVIVDLCLSEVGRSTG